ncbi:MAG: DUF3179 domain-containing protein [Planctomycetaceae bacterium]|nr:DUF3179 domain-containing protein [Planctomycetaceae bacterium]
MAYTFRNFCCVLLLMSAVFGSMSPVSAQRPNEPTDFVRKQQEIKARFDRRMGRPENEAVHKPPMIRAGVSDLGDDEPVIGVSISGDARAYPLVMLFNGGGVFELLNDTCGEHPIAVSW